MKIEYMYKNDVCAVIMVDFENEVVTVENLKDNIVFKPFGIHKKISMSDFYEFLEFRCFPRTRVNVKELLSDKLYGYEPLLIVLETHGTMADDCFWLRFDDEDLKWEDVNIWNKVNNIKENKDGH